ncbi:MAG: SDR family oxidoreductase, partial [Myxococcales bacterium]|nr:SDR family oxidoreductase [Myxococcales bacterium]
AAALDAVGVADYLPVACDLGDLASVMAAVSAVAEPLDGIIANAGIMALPEVTRIQGIESQFFVNHVGHFVLVNGLVGRLNFASRVVILSSAAHRMASRGLELDNLDGGTDYEPWRLYGRSKLANIYFAQSLARRLRGGASVNAVHPGVIETNLGRHIPEDNRVAMYERFRPILKTMGQGAATQCLVAVRPEVEATTGAYFSDCVRTPTTPADLPEAEGERLWALTEKIVGELLGG